MIQDFADWLVYKVLEFAPTQLGEAVNFFVYDTVKIFFLLYAISFIMGVVNAYFPRRTYPRLSNDEEALRTSIFFRGSVRGYYAVLFLFFHSFVHRVRERRHSPRGNICFPDYISFGQ